jgi:hypothetical protein
MNMGKARLPTHKAGFTGAHVPVKIVAAATLGVFAEIGLYFRRLNGLTSWSKSGGELEYRKLCRSHSVMIEMQVNP